MDGEPKRMCTNCGKKECHSRHSKYCLQCSNNRQKIGKKQHVEKSSWGRLWGLATGYRSDGITRLKKPEKSLDERFKGEE